MSETPDYLYHYTSIEVLSLILKHKTIRFNRLDLVDDPEEIATDDFGNFGRFCFVSCWTSENEESIPMWRMYSNDLKGVRIKLPVFPILKHSLFNKSINRNNYDKSTDTVIINDTDLFQSYVDVDMILDKNLSSPPILEEILKKVEYTDCENLISPKVYTETEMAMETNTEKRTEINKMIDLEKIGIYKRKYWEFQHEFRYRFFVSPFGQEDVLAATSVESHIEFFERYKKANISQHYFDFKLDVEKFKDMIITLGPKANEAEKIIIDLLVQKFNPTAKVEFSKIKIR